MPRTLIVIILLVAAAPARAAAPGGLGADAAARLRAGSPVQLVLDGRSLNLRARPNPILAAGTTPALVGGRRVALSEITTFVGAIAELPAARVRLAIRDDVRGLIVMPDGTPLEIRPRRVGGSDLIPASQLHHDEIGEDGRAVPAGHAVDAPRQRAAGRLRLRIALEADYRFYSSHTTTWANDLLEAINHVEMVYDPQIDTEFEVVWLGAWDVNDPYVASSHACWNSAQPRDGKLERLASYWQQNRSDIARDAVHLAVGQISGAFIGCAYIEALASYAYGVSRVFAGATSLYDDTNLLAHELGHNFGGLHERSVGRYGVTGAGNNPPYTIMNPTAVQGVLRLSDLTGVRSPNTGWELDNTTPMRRHAEARLAPL